MYSADMTSPAARMATVPWRRVGRYALFDAIGHGGTSTVHIGRLLGPAGFSKTVAIKRMHEHVGRDPQVAAMFLDEARLSARIRHPNVVATTDLLAIDGETFLVMEYVHGAALSTLNDILRQRGERMPPAIALHIMRDALHGLHAAHEAQDSAGNPLHLVHRDVSPQNILLGIDGSARVLDFGIAKALGRLQETHDGQVKGKLAYMAPEQLLGQPIDRRVDVFAAGVVLWECLAGRRLFAANSPGEVVHRVLTEDVPDLRTIVPGVSPLLAQAVARATQRDPAQRYASACDFARALEHGAELVTARAVGEWARKTAGERLGRLSQRLQEIERTPLNELAPAGFISDAPVEDAPLFDGAGPDDVTRSEVQKLGVTARASEPTPTSSAPSVVKAAPTTFSSIRTKPSLRVAALAVALAIMGLAVPFLFADDPEPAATRAPNPVQVEAPAKAAITTAQAEESAPIPVPQVVGADAVPSSEVREKPVAPKPATGVRRPVRAKPAVKPSAKSTKPAVQTPRRAEDLFSRN